MLANRPINRSPIKQNLSPCSPSHSPRKHAINTKHLIQLLKQHNIPIPQQLIQKTIQKQKHPQCQIKLKEIQLDNNANLVTQNKRLKVQLNDVKFQLKKIQEDFAEYKVLARMEKQKIVKKYLGEIELLKKKVEDDNSMWEKRYTQKCQQFLLQKNSFQTTLQNEFNQKTSSQSTQLKNQYELKITTLETKIQHLSKTVKSQESLYKVEREKLIEELKQKTETQLTILKMTSTQKQKEITKKLENKIEVIQFEKKVDTKKFQDNIHLLENQVSKLKNEIYFVQKEKEELRLDLKVKQRKILQLQMAIRAKQQVYQDIKQEFQQQKLRIHQENDQKTTHLQTLHATELKQLMSHHLNELDSYYQKINNLQQRKLRSEEIMKDEMAILQQKFSQRQSKTEDWEEIQRLNMIMAMKDRELSRYQEELRSSELQRVNNEKNYTKIFSTYSSRRKSSNSHRDRDRQTIFKQSNTTDLKMLLKICNKDF